MTTSVDELAARIARIEDALARGTVGQLGRSSFEGGGITQYTPDGSQILARYGEQFDGTGGLAALSGPTPPTPTAPTLVPIPNGIKVIWDGHFAGGQFVVAPMDYSRTEIHLSQYADLDGLHGETFVNAFGSPRGGEMDVLGLVPGASYYVRLTGRANTGKASIPSAVAGPVSPLLLGPDDLDIDFDALGGNQIFTGTTEPTGTHKIGDLWLQKPDNIAHRWDGDTWEELRDQGVAQALQDAFDANAVATQAGIDALAAQSAAGTAQGAATAAAGVAAGKTTTFRQDTAPPTTGRTVGDSWYDTANGERLSVWGANNQWNLAPLGAAGIAATARQLGAITTYRQASAPTSGMIVGDFWIRSADNKLHRYEGSTPTWVAVTDADITAAINSAATAQSTADGKMRIFTQPTAPTGLLPTDVGDLWIDTDDSNVSYTWELVSGTTYGWTKRQLGNGAIQPQSLVASNVVATGTVTAALLETVLVLATTIIAGSPTGERLQMDSAGLYVYSVDPATTTPFISSRLGGPGDDFIGTTDSTGNVKAGLDSTGQVIGVKGSFSDDLIVRGRSLINEIASDGPRGQVAWAHLAAPVGRVAEGGDVLMGFMAEPGRMYQVLAGPCQLIGTVATDDGIVSIHYSIGASTIPTTADPYLTHMVARHNTSVSINTMISLGPVGVNYSTPQWVQLLFCHGRNFGSGSFSLGNTAGSYLQVNDIGPYTSDKAVIGGASPPPSQAAQDRTLEVAPTWWRTWDGAGALMSQGDNLLQGYAGATIGNTKSMVGFADITATLAGATVNRAWIWTYTPWWSQSTGGYPQVGNHPNLNTVSTWPSGATGIISGPKMGRGESRLIELPKSWLAGLQSGTIRGVTFGPAPSNDLSYYGYHHAPSVRLRVSYTK